MSMFKSKWFKITMAILLLLLILLCIPAIARFVGGLFGVDGEVIQGHAQKAFMLALGLFLISVGAASVAVPIVGIVLVVVGLILVGFAAWGWFGPDDDPNPDEVNISELND